MSGAAPSQRAQSWEGQVLVPGEAEGPALCLDEPLSMWGGLDPVTGTIIDARHPQVGICATDAVVVMATGRGSSSASSVLVEAVSEATAPAAFVLSEPDHIIALGAVVASELYGRDVPVVVVAPEVLDQLRTGDRVEVRQDGTVVATPASGG